MADSCPAHQVWILCQPPPDPELQVLLSEEQQECVPAAQCGEPSTTELSSNADLWSSTDHSPTVEPSTVAAVSVLPHNTDISPTTVSVLPHSPDTTPATQDRLTAMAADTADRSH